MLKKLDISLKSNNGLDVVPVYLDEDLYVTDTQTPTNYCVNPVIILKKDIFLQKYNENIPDNTQYVVVFMTKLSAVAQKWCIVELEYLLHTHYDTFIEHNDIFTNYGYNEETQAIHICDTQPVTADPSGLLVKMMSEIDINAALQDGVAEVSYRITKLAVEQIEFVRNKYTNLIHADQMTYVVASIVKEMQARLNYVKSCQYWQIPVMHLVPGALLDYAVAEALGMRIKLNDEYGFLVKYSEEYMGELYGVLKEKDDTVWSVFNPSSNDKHVKYTYEKYPWLKNPNSDNFELVKPEQLRSWPNWDEKYGDKSVILLYAACASILMIATEEDPIQKVKMVKIPEALLKFK